MSSISSLTDLGVLELPSIRLIAVSLEREGVRNEFQLLKLY